MNANRSIAFFDAQFRQQVQRHEWSLNPFEEVVLPHLHGDVLDFGCGMGNLACAAAARGCTVTALDGSEAAIAHLRQRTAAEGLAVDAGLADLRDYPVQGDYDAVVSIGLLMFFDCPTAFRLLALLGAHVRPGGLMAINVLVEGTTYLEMFEVQRHCLFHRDELASRFAGWAPVLAQEAEFGAPGGTVKAFVTWVARKPRD